MLTSVVPQSPKIKEKLKRIRALVDAGWQGEVISLMEDGVRHVRNLTPRSPGPGPHLDEGWTLHQIGGKRKSMVAGPLLIIYNSMVMRRTGQFLKSAYLKVGGKRVNYTLLHILEYGSRAHKIEPIIRAANEKTSLLRLAMKPKKMKVKTKWLVFQTKEGQWVKTKLVHHPGTRPYGMIRLTMAWLRGRLEKLVDKWEKRIEKEFER